ncbi:uncharacterized protein LOC117122221 [Anneissia japonica]|uniref:uncharacterized protein LOC117122221 n=1 Tax=Anneissia japonica TaxID=1529436 RepID=UPI001425B9A9|nr:uncharacterized protein LOC117122221 [Anneissia japonica]
MASRPHEKGNELHQAIYSKNWSKVKRLMRGKPQLVNEIDEDGFTPLHYAASKFDDTPEDVCVLLVEQAKAATLDILYPRPWVRHSLLHQLSRRGFSTCVSRVLEKSKTRINTQTKFDQTALHWCAVSNLSVQQHFKIIHALLSNGADVTIRDKFGDTAAELYQKSKCEYENKKEEIPMIEYLLRGEIPHQILLKGIDTVLMYVKALEVGGELFNKCSVTVVGQARAGKTSLIKRLTGQRFNSQEEETDGIVTTKTYTIDEKEENWILETRKFDGQC